MPLTIRHLFGICIALAALSLLFWLLERRWRPHPAKPAADLRADLGYWFLTPLLSKAIARAGTVLVAAPVLWLAGRDLSRASLLAGHGPVVQWPAWLQAVAVIVVGDFVGYWTHRAFHRGRLWRFHAVHHSSTTLDWLSSVRVHPVNDVLTRMVQALPFLACGFSPLVVSAWLPFLTFYAIFVHADLRWDFGPLRYLIATPEFHRWHHTSEQEGLDRNFAGLLPAWDLLFGSFYMPRGRRAERFGAPGAGVPDGLLAQLAFPFRRQRA